MHNVSFDQQPATTVLSKALLMYTYSTTLSSRPDREIASVSEHEVVERDGKPLIMEGHVLSKNSLNKMAKMILGKKPDDLELIPENMLAQTDNAFVWWIPARKEKVFFKTLMPGLKNRAGDVYIPSTLFAVINSTSYVLCFEGNERPNGDTPLFYSPYFNVSDNHVICMGTTKKTKERDIKAWTKAFFDSAFVHSNYRTPEAELLRKGDRKLLWQDLLDNKLEAFPFTCLPPANLTLNQFLKEIAT